MGAMFWETIHLNQKKKVRSDVSGIKIISIEAQVTHPGVPPWYVVIGVDPGVNFGISVLTHNLLTVHSGKLPHKQALVGFEAIKLWADMIRAGLLPVWGTYVDVYTYIEGPAYSETVGQPLLEQIRFGFAVAAMTAGWNPQYLQPNTARKLAFGSGKRAGKDIWMLINQNAADSVGLALAGAALQSTLAARTEES